MASQGLSPGLAKVVAGKDNEFSSGLKMGRTQTLAPTGGVDQAQTTETRGKKKKDRGESLFCLTATLWAMSYYYPHEETEAQRGEGHTVCKGVPGMCYRFTTLPGAFLVKSELAPERGGNGRKRLAPPGG